MAKEEEQDTSRRTRMSQVELDEEAQGFALGLINTWVRNPASVRLLRVAVDLWPSRQVAEALVQIFNPYVDKPRNDPKQKVVAYCMSEILRAGATETGIVPETEMLPKDVNLDGYRSVFAQLAVRILNSKSPNLPWFLRQQAILFLAVHKTEDNVNPTGSQASATTDYAEIAEFLRRPQQNLSDEIFATRAVVARRSFMTRKDAIHLLAGHLDGPKFLAIAARDLEFARELFPSIKPEMVQNSSLSDDLAIGDWSLADDAIYLSKMINAEGDLNPLRNEIGVLTFSIAFLKQVSGKKTPDVVTPSNLQLRYDHVGNYAHVREVMLQSLNRGPGYRSIYTPPSWVSETDKWRFQLGFLLRYILTAKTDFSVTARSPSWREDEQIYRPTRSHWLQRLYGFFNGHESFGDDWLPISQFTQDLIYSLLAWPGCRAETKIDAVSSIEELDKALNAQLAIAMESIGEATGVLMLKLDAPLPTRTKADRPLRACVVQTVTPEYSEIKADLTVSSKQIRRKHRNHLSTALSAVEKMLELRDTHKDQNQRLDWLILPELSVHRDDIATHLIPFARKFKTIIFAGLTYQELFVGRPLVNAAVWIIPRMVDGGGLQVSKRLQGKHHLAPLEQEINSASEQIMGFRPCQWIIGYDWSASGNDALWLTGAICYDSTDLRLASDLRDRSDIFAIPALNQDVGTFDHMAQALHYHMYQLVIVANNGEFGGSNAYMPQGEVYKRQIFHTHGQPQATISFLEIDDINDVKGRRSYGKQKAPNNNKWKFPPAGC